jgi:hypothetical protein
MSGGKFIAPRVITDFRQRLVCVLPLGFYFDDDRWKKSGNVSRRKATR